uniref:Integrase, catalytic region, zinc finger, CCHC-type, peptidase aspartic, catalytic n=1 Tax=Tanacetum cinerariifolium TaxID=118510 RepID=A0A6L2K391_TANCI|nr:hypothetical protein [Tanacetum cinerariifolium]
MEEFATNDKANYYSGIESIIVNGKRAYELKGKFLEDLCDNAFSETNRKDAVEHIKYFLKIVDPINLPNVNYERLRLFVFLILLVGNARKWFDEFKDYGAKAIRDPRNFTFEKWLALKLANHMIMDPFTKNVLWDFWNMSNDYEGVAEEFSDVEKANNDGEQEMDDIFRIKTNLFDYETPTKTYKDYENKLNNELEEPWSKDGVPYETYDHICEPFHFINGKAKWDDEEYVVVKENEYNDLTITSEDACRAYQEIFRIMDEGWMAMTFLIVVASLRFPSTNNQLRTSSNLRNHATIQDDKESGQILDEKQLAFFTDPSILNGQAAQTTIPNIATFQTEDLDVYDSDCDDISNAKAVLMASLSNYGSNVILEIKPTLYDDSVIYSQHAASPVVNDEKILILEEVSRSKMLAKQNDPMSKEKKVNTTPINYVELNLLSKDFGKCFVPQQELFAEQAFWLQTLHHNTDQSALSPVKIEAPKELPKITAYMQNKNVRISYTPISNMKNKVKVQCKKVESKSNKKNRVKDPICDANVKHTMLNVNSELIYVKCKQCMFDANHDVCFFDFVNDVNVRSKSKSAKKIQQHNIWKPTGKVFTEVGYKWKPIGRLFTLVGNSCPLTRFTLTKAVHLPKTTYTSGETQKQETKVYSRRPKQVTSIGIRSQLMNSVSKFLGTVRLKNGQISKIIGYGDYQLGNIFVSRNLEGIDLLSGSRDTNLYTISLDDMLKTSPTYLLSKASNTKS